MKSTPDREVNHTVEWIYTGIFFSIVLGVLTLGTLVNG